MRTRWTSMLAVALLALPGLAAAQTVWVDDPANPVVPATAPGDWDAERYITTVVEVDGTYHMFFEGHVAGSALLEDYDIGHATSADGVSWQVDPANPVLTRGAAGDWDAASVACPAVIHDGSQFRMWYVGSGDERGWVGYATSPDGSVWAKHAGNPILEPGPTGSFDDDGIWPGTVVFDGERYRMWYTGNRRVATGEDADWRIGHAESADGLSWTRHPVPVLDPGVGWDGWLVWGPSVLVDGSGYQMWYSGLAGAGMPSIGYAVSPDGLSWTRFLGNPVVGEADRALNWASVLHDGATGLFRMWYTINGDYSFNLATSNCCATVYSAFIPAAAYAAGAQGSFFQTDLDLSNADSVAAEYELWWLPRGEDNSDPMVSDLFSLGAGMSVRYANVVGEVFDLEPDALGALAIASTSPRLLAMSRTYNLPGDGASGSYGQSMAAVGAEQLIGPGKRARILFATEHAEMRTNVGCQNATGEEIALRIDLFDMAGNHLSGETLVLQPWGNDQLNRIFADFAPVSGYVEVWSPMPDAVYYCYGSVLDNTTSDPTTIPAM